MDIEPRFVKPSYKTFILDPNKLKESIRVESICVKVCFRFWRTGTPRQKGFPGGCPFLKPQKERTQNTQTNKYKTNSKIRENTEESTNEHLDRQLRTLFSMNVTPKTQQQ